MEDHVLRSQTINCLIPQPEILPQYREFIGDAPERILRVFEADSADIRAIRSRALESTRNDNCRFQWMAYSLIAGGYGISVLFACMDKDILFGIVLTTTIIGTVSGFMKQRHDTPIERTENGTLSE
ncbi:hypothetical protein F2P45_31470 [Massilia sp. CCM 8733]|uniref:DUF2335 domain-containing protein n=1 Tax=Massilia mucilaginosa TaxID=2609282 RepID=A0ABX0P2D8_9BURK|nr:hypothetical protein [Massilia mucilaginosa]NHZ93489.1 hypothetical protein [Massilia mucilaginosa]